MSTVSSDYPAVFASYARYCLLVGSDPVSFEDWMYMRDYVSDEEYEIRRKKRQSVTFAQYKTRRKWGMKKKWAKLEPSTKAA